MQAGCYVDPAGAATCFAVTVGAGIWFVSASRLQALLHPPVETAPPFGNLALEDGV